MMDNARAFERPYGNPRTSGWRVSLPDDDDPFPLRQSFAIEQNHPLIPIWPKLRHDILAILEAGVYEWSALEVFRRRYHYECPSVDDTTVIVTAKKDDERSWTELAASIHRTCCKHGQTQLWVELVDGKVARFGTSLADYAVKARMGSSIGLHGNDSETGTMGGYLLLKKAGSDDAFCALTCHHTLCPQQQGEAEPAASLVGVMKPDENLRIEQPGGMDHIDAMKKHEAGLNDTEKDIREKKNEIDQGIVSERAFQYIAIAEEHKCIWEEQLAAAQNFDRRFGHVFATSGHRKAAEGMALDWGLVLVNEARKGQNRVELRHYLEPPYRIPEQHVVQHFGKLKEENHVVHLGVRLGPSSGRFSYIKSNVKWPELRGEYTEERVITGLHNGDFATKGDSGAFVLGHDGSLVGILIGGPDGGGHGYVTPIEVILADILARTGYTAELPDAE